jgi:hypothetical protein
MLQREPFPLWIGCVNQWDGLHAKISPEQKSTFAPNPEELIWRSVVVVDISIWNSFFWRKLLGLCSSDQLKIQAEQQLEKLLSEEPGIDLIRIDR